MPDKAQGCSAATECIQTRPHIKNSACPTLCAARSCEEAACHSCGSKDSQAVTRHTRPYSTELRADIGTLVWTHAARQGPTANNGAPSDKGQRGVEWCTHVRGPRFRVRSGSTA